MNTTQVSVYPCVLYVCVCVCAYGHESEAAMPPEMLLAPLKEADSFNEKWVKCVCEMFSTENLQECVYSRLH